MLSITLSTRARTLLCSLATVYLTARTRTLFLKSTVSQLNTNVNLRKLKTSNYFEICINQVLVKDYYYIWKILDCKKTLFFLPRTSCEPLFCLLLLQNNSQYLLLIAHGSKEHQFLSSNCALIAPGTGCLRVTCPHSLTQLHEVFTGMELLIEHSSLRAGNWERRTLSPCSY